MKKYNLLKAIGFALLIVVLLSWVVPAGTFTESGFSSLPTAPIGLHDIISSPVVAIVSFLQYGLLFLAIGGFYGVLNKTGAYCNLVNKIVKKYNKNEKKCLTIISVVMVLLSALIGSNSFLLILVPFLITILLKLGYSKLTAFGSTIGGILIGNVCSITGTDIWTNLTMGLGLKVFDNLIVKIIMFIVITTLFAFMITKKSKLENEKDIPLFEEVKSKKDTLPLVVVGLIFLVLLFIGLFHWKELFNITFFDELYESLTTVKVAGYPLFANILGKISKLGYYSDYDIVINLMVSSFVISWLYNIKFTEYLDAFINGCKKMVVPAIYAMLSCIVFVTIAQLHGNFVFTMINKFMSGSEEASIVGTVASALVSSPIYNNFSFLLGNVYTIFSTYDKAQLPVIGFIFQAIHSLVMLIVPTSMVLVSGLSYMNISYKEWVDYIWKFLIVLLALVIILIVIMAMFI